MPELFRTGKPGAAAVGADESRGSRVAAIALGSNLPSRFGAPAANLDCALERLLQLGSLRAVSSYYTTDPVGYTDQPRFTNAAALLETELAPLELLRALLAIERDMGRNRADAVPAKGPRIIDLDLLLAGDTVVRTPELTLPHPDMLQRRFVLEPLAEIAPGLIHPSTGQTIRDHLSRLT